jgi:sugar phosphate isomerase/epimerase
VLSLAAATVLDLSPAAAVECAAEAGYALCGVRLERPKAEGAAVAAALNRTGIGLLDVEVVRIGPGPLTDLHRRLAQVAGELGARFLLTVSQDPDEAATTDRVAELAALLAGSPTRVAIEPMVFTALRTRADAERLARAVPGTTVLLDPLHLYRAGTALDLPPDPALTGYAQLSDTATETAPEDPAHEARHDRVPPGHGVLPLAEFLTALPAGLPLSVEVQSDRLAAELDPVPRARMIRSAALATIAAARAPAATPTGP